MGEVHLHDKNEYMWKVQHLHKKMIWKFSKNNGQGLSSWVISNGEVKSCSTIKLISTP